MSLTKDRSMSASGAPVEEQASETFVRRMYGEWSEQDQAAFELRLERDGDFAQAWREVEKSWSALDAHAEAPEVIAYREEALAVVRRANARRWLRPDRGRWRVAAVLAGLALIAASAWQMSPMGYRPGEYRTGIGEQRMIELADHSRLALDAATRLNVRYSDDARTVQLLQGQAQFFVAKDPARPFKVIAGDRTIVALGTVFTVEYVDRKVHVAMLEGKVAVLSAAPVSRESGTSSGAPPGGIPLSAGEELRVLNDGHAVVTPKADLEAATAWREGKVIFRTESLRTAVNRMNRYSRLQVEIDDASLAARQISGVFEMGDTRGFVDAIQRYLPVTADYSDSDIVRLQPK